ncbi:MAG: GAF domain-containing protein [Thermomicrobiales bacterium]|nr:GAF domain-containing protein [Thermomicrobiales bacterium]
MSDVTGSGDVYTMAEAARLKGVSYHTVSRAVRRGKLPATRLGRMALIQSEDLREWRPMRERAPRKYRRREPNPEATPALLDLASSDRVELASQLAAVYEAIHLVVDDSPREELYDLIVDRLAGTLNLRRVSILLLDNASNRTIRVASYGPPISNLPAELAFENSPLGDLQDQPARAIVAEIDKSRASELSGLNLKTVMVAPIRLGGKPLGFLVGDRNGEAFALDAAGLDLAQAMANLVSAAIARARTPEVIGAM